MATFTPVSSIRTRLIRLISGIAGLVLLISMTGVAVIEWGDQRKHLHDSLTASANAIGTASAAALAFGDSKAAAESLRLISTLSEIEGAAIYDYRGIRMAAQGDLRQLPQSADGLVEHLPELLWLSPVTTLFQPIWLDDALLGHIYVRASLAEAHQSFLNLALLSLGVNAMGLLLAIGLGQRYLASILTPVNALADTARQVREGADFSRRVPVEPALKRHDELSDLVASFNAMLNEIQARDQSLSDYQRTLEARVHERTQALLEAKLHAEAASLSKSRFLAAASHDLRQPIQAVGLFAMALNRTDLNDAQKDISALLGRSVASLSELLNMLLDVSQLDTGAIVPHFEALDVPALFADIELAFSALASDKRLRFMLHYPEAAPDLRCDRKLLLRLLRNLVGNAIKYTAQGGVLVALRRRGDYALLQVWDTGIGIAPEHVAKIFDEYYQLGNEERDMAKGLGLGLSIAQRLASVMGTQITCRSRPGHGSIFELRLPTQKVDVCGTAIPESLTDARAGSDQT